MVTLKDIAKIAGVSTSTVSKALRNATDISEQTRLEIIQIAKDLNYDYNPPKSESPDGPNAIGVICPEVTSNYYSQIVSVIEEEAKEKGYFCIIGFTNFESENEKYYLKTLLKANVKGIVFISEALDFDGTLAQYKEETSIPLVLIAQNGETKDFDCIRIDDDYGVRLAVEHLIKLGHKDIGYVGDELSNTRLATFMDVLQENQLKINKKWLQVGQGRFEKCGYESMTNILNGTDIPSAVVGAYDDIAIGAIKAIHDNGLNVPDDISVVGIDNVRVASYYSPEITTVAGPIDEMGKIAVKLLLRKVSNNEYNVIQNVRLTPSLINRKSTMAINGKNR